MGERPAFAGSRWGRGSRIPAAGTRYFHPTRSTGRPSSVRSSNPVRSRRAPERTRTRGIKNETQWTMPTRRSGREIQRTRDAVTRRLCRRRNSRRVRRLQSTRTTRSARSAIPGQRLRGRRWLRRPGRRRRATNRGVRPLPARIRAESRPPVTGDHVTPPMAHAFAPVGAAAGGDGVRSVTNRRRLRPADRHPTENRGVRRTQGQRVPVFHPWLAGVVPPTFGSRTHRVYIF